MILSRRKHTESQKDFMEKGIVKLFFYLFIYFWLCWVFTAAYGLSLFGEQGLLFTVMCGL